MTEHRCYAVRRLNPFAGVLQVCETHDARAYSANGRVWQVQVVGDRPDHTWRSTGELPPIQQFFNFGLWDADDGLSRVVANPLMDIGAMTSAADALCAGLARLNTRLPFPLIDHYELWSVDYPGLPVALLASTERADLTQEQYSHRWCACSLSEHRFTSATLLATGVATQGPLGPRQHAEQLESTVNARGQRREWYLRHADGSGERLHASLPALIRPAGDFPPLGLRRHWDDPTTAGMVADYLAWMAPRLLTLQHLDDDLRRALEIQALGNVLELDLNYPLIPHQIDRRGIAAARVQARLLRTANTATQRA